MLSPMNGIADYEFTGELGESNYGLNYLARTPARLGLSAPHVVVKVISGPTSADAVRRATRELRHFAAARSDRLVRIFDAGQSDGAFFYVMEHLERGSLAEPVGSLEPAHAVRAVRDAAVAAHALHEVGIAHRDIKPGNILLAEDGGRLSDLGLSQVLSPGVVFTGLGQIGLEYSDPVIMTGSEASRATDIWSLAASLHFAVTGQGVYGELPSTEPLLLVRSILARQPTVSAQVPEQFRALISSGLDADILRRPRTAEEFATRLTEVIGG